MNPFKRDRADHSVVTGDFAPVAFERQENERLTVVDRAVILISRVSMLLILVGVAIMFYEVVMRYVFNSPTSWVYKKSLWLGAIVYLMSGAYAMQRRKHIRITAVYNIAPNWTRLAFDYLTLFVLVVYATLMLVGGTELAYDALLNWIQSGQLLDPSINGTIKPLLLITTVVVVIVAINNMLVDNCGFGKISPTSRTEKDND